eukprot:810824_1
MHVALLRACFASMFGSCAGSLLCSFGKHKTTSKAMHVVFFALNALIAVVLQHVLPAHRTFVDGFLKTTLQPLDAECPTCDVLKDANRTSCLENCYGDQVVFRIGFSMAVFYLLHAIASRFWAKANNFCWPGKAVFYGLMVIGTLYMPPAFFYGFRWVAYIGAGIFILVDIMILIDFTYEWNETWVAKEETMYNVLLLVFSGLFIGLSLTGWILEFLWFAKPYPAAGQTAADISCALPNVMISIVMVVSIGFTLLSVTSYIEHGALLPSSAMMLYLTYRTYDALKSNPAMCSKFPPSARNWSMKIVSLLLALAAICYSAVKLGYRSSNLFGGGEVVVARKDSVSLEEGKGGANDSGDESGMEQDIDDDGSPQSSYRAKKLMYFHLIMFVASLYIDMALTNWATPRASARLATGDLGTASMWAKTIAIWATMMAYIWTLVAPYVLEGREF